MYIYIYTSDASLGRPHGTRNGTSSMGSASHIYIHICMYTYNIYICIYIHGLYLRRIIGAAAGHEKRHEKYGQRYFYLYICLYKYNL